MYKVIFEKVVEFLIAVNHGFLLYRINKTHKAIGLIYSEHVAFSFIALLLATLFAISQKMLPTNWVQNNHDGLVKHLFHILLSFSRTFYVFDGR